MRGVVRVLYGRVLATARDLARRLVVPDDAGLAADGTRLVSA